MLFGLDTGHEIEPAHRPPQRGIRVDVDRNELGDIDDAVGAVASVAVGNVAVGMCQKEQPGRAGAMVRRVGKSEIPMRLWTPLRAGSDEAPAVVDCRQQRGCGLRVGDPHTAAGRCFAAEVGKTSIDRDVLTDGCGAVTEPVVDARVAGRQSYQGRAGRRDVLVQPDEHRS